MPKTLLMCPRYQLLLQQRLTLSCCSAPQLSSFLILKKGLDRFLDRDSVRRRFDLCSNGLECWRLSWQRGMFHLTSFCLGRIPVSGPSGYADPFAVKHTLDPLLTMTAPPMTITSAVALGSVAGIDEKMHKDREESKTEIPLGQNSGVQIGTSKNRQAVSGRNKKVKHGGASRDRRA